MPAPMITPTPNTIRSSAPRSLRSLVSGSSVSRIDCSMDLVRNTLMGSNLHPRGRRGQTSARASLSGASTMSTRRTSPSSTVKASTANVRPSRTAASPSRPLTSHRHVRRRAGLRGDPGHEPGDPVGPDDRAPGGAHDAAAVAGQHDRRGRAAPPGRPGRHRPRPSRTHRPPGRGSRRRRRRAGCRPRRGPGPGWRAGARPPGVRPTARATSSNGSSNRSCSTHAVRSAGVSCSSTTSSA